MIKNRCEERAVPREEAEQTLPCGCKWTPAPRDLHGPVFWNPYNRVAQCHKCGQVYAPPAEGAPQ